MVTTETLINDLQDKNRNHKKRKEVGGNFLKHITH